MSRVIYNGIELMLVKTHRIEKRVLYQGPDYIGTEHIFDVTGVYNPGATSYNPPTAGAFAPGAAPAARPGNLPALTERAIRDWLSQPRRTLIYIVGDQEVLRSPAPLPDGVRLGAAGGPAAAPDPTTPVCDVTGGPFVLRPAEVLQVWGEKTFVVRLAVSTVINESYLNVTNPPTLLSNRWESQADYDDCAFETRTYRGKAVFRLDLLTSRLASDQARQMVADDLRDYFASFAISPGFQREVLHCKQTPLGDACDYVVRDVQLPVTLTDQRAMRLEAIWDTVMESPGLETLLTNNAFDAVEIMGASKGNWSDLLKVIPFARRNLGYLPRTSEVLVITARGHPGSSRANLARVCYSVLASTVPLFARQDIVGVAVPNAVWPAVYVRARKDLVGKYFQLTVQIERGPLQTQIAGVPAIFPPADDGIPNVTSAAPGVQPPYPGDAGVRGTSLEALVWQALMNVPYQAPTRPPAPIAALQGQGA